jgi:hypothetical protein
MTEPVEVGFAILFAGLLLLMFRKWLRTAPGSADRRTLPIMMWLMASMLLQLVPKLMWPSASVLNRITLVLGLTSIIAIAVILRRDKHRMSKSAKP